MHVMIMRIMNYFIFKITCTGSVAFTFNPNSDIFLQQVPLKGDLPVGDGMQYHMQYHFRNSIKTPLNMNKKKALDEQSIMGYIFYKTGKRMCNKNKT